MTNNDICIFGKIINIFDISIDDLPDPFGIIRIWSANNQAAILIIK